MCEFDRDSRVNKELITIAAERGEEILGTARTIKDARRVCDYRHIRLKCGHQQDIRISHYRKQDYSCKTCLDQRIKDVAAYQGLELVSTDIVRHCNERLYRRPCGHTEIKSHNYLEKHAILECQECIDLEIHKNLEKQNLKFEKRVRTGCVVSCNVCSNEWTVRTSTARYGEPLCENCFNTTLKKEANSSGFTFLPEIAPKKTQSPSRITLKRWYSCNDCGHVATYQHTSMRLGHVKCSKCYETRLMNDAQIQGMKYLGHSVGMFHNYELPCGCMRQLQPFSVQRGVWACREHDETYYRRENSVYLIKMELQDKSWLKLGFAKDIDIRVKGYGLPEGCTHTLIFRQHFATGYEAMDVEKMIHRNMKHHRISPVAMKELMQNTGHTECYPVDCEDLLLNKLQECCANLKLS